MVGGILNCLNSRVCCCIVLYWKCSLDDAYLKCYQVFFPTIVFDITIAVYQNMFIVFDITIAVYQNMFLQNW